MGIEIQVVVSELGRQTGVLNKAATVAKREGNLEEAIRLLREVKELHGVCYHDTRLAKFLEQAGQFEEARIEIQWLIDHSRDWVDAELEHCPRPVRRMHQAGWISMIHKDAALICRRARRPDLEEFHSAEWARWAEIRERLLVVTDSHDAMIVRPS